MLRSEAGRQAGWSTGKWAQWVFPRRGPDQMSGADVRWLEKQEQETGRQEEEREGGLGQKQTLGVG